jgi:hypothetical protein
MSAGFATIYIYILASSMEERTQVQLGGMTTRNRRKSGVATPEWLSQRAAKPGARASSPPRVSAPPPASCCSCYKEKSLYENELICLPTKNLFPEQTIPPKKSFSGQRGRRCKDTVRGGGGARCRDHCSTGGDSRVTLTYADVR